MDELAKERYEMAVEMIREIREEKTVAEPYLDFFTKTAGFLEEMIRLRDRVEAGEMKKLSLEELRRENTQCYQDILPEHYETSYANPAYAQKLLGKEFGPLICFLEAEIRGLIVFVYENRLFDMTVILELFVQIYNLLEEPSVSAEEVRESLYWYVSDYSEEMVSRRIREAVDPDLDFAVKIIENSDLSDVRYLYRFGEYVTRNEEEMASFLSEFSQEEIDKMARTFSEGYRIGCVVGKKDLSES